MDPVRRIIGVPLLLKANTYQDRFALMCAGFDDVIERYYIPHSAVERLGLVPEGYQLLLYALCTFRHASFYATSVGPIGIVINSLSSSKSTQSSDL